MARAGNHDTARPTLDNEELPHRTPYILVIRETLEAANVKRCYPPHYSEYPDTLDARLRDELPQSAHDR